MTPKNKARGQSLSPQQPLLTIANADLLPGQDCRRASMASLHVASAAYSYLATWLAGYPGYQDAVWIAPDRRQAQIGTKEHDRALRLMLLEFSRMAVDGVRQRIAFALPPGTAKSQSILAFLTALHVVREKGLNQYTAIVACSQIEDLCTMVREIEARGIIPMTKVGLLHAKKYDVAMVDAVLEEDPRARDYGACQQE